MSGAACLTVEASNWMDASLRKRILLVDDHLVVRESLVLLLAQRMPELRFVEAASLMQAQLVLGSMGDIDLVLLDLDLPDSRGLATLTALRATAPGVPVVATACR
jgi:DNA-binding NarL/FixJ family response regulator